ncbi:pilus assembly protein TadG-related protein [Streptomyces sp. YIM 130001]|uniref:pilus assembly protein TadG-related protein n=1 Tax=Streptomyces sp. YIM 130001 TaxID=2259644 RepID=UPI000E65B645|nr:pilus assembly protein TadG-related protein [Streptomyces sp. YIM 130001]
MRNDKGQTLPLYVWLVGILLFVAFVFFVFAKAAVARSGAQSAADAAALAAAKEARKELLVQVIAGIPSGAWVLPLEGETPPVTNGAASAAQLAKQNKSHLDGAPQATFVASDFAIKAKVETDYTVGDSLVPGTEKKHAKADATAVIEPRCHMIADVPTKVVKFYCEGSGMWDIDPKTFNAGDLPTAKDLFKVHLAE